MRRTFVVLLALLAVTAAAADNRRAPRAVPDWLRDGVVYEIFPRAFSPAGTFKGILLQLDRLQSLGVTVIWLMPIHPTGKEKQKGTLGSPYAVRDYDAVNPDFGTPAEFRQLIAAAHERGMKVFIDIVANHTAWDSNLNAKHSDSYTRDAAGKNVPPNPDRVDVEDHDYSKP